MKLTVGPVSPLVVHLCMVFQGGVREAIAPPPPPTGFFVEKSLLEYTVIAFQLLHSGFLNVVEPWLRTKTYIEL